MLLYRKLETSFNYPVLWFTIHSLKISMHGWDKAVLYQDIEKPDWTSVEYLTEESLLVRIKFKRIINDTL